jgi:hypothetical protein
MIWQTFGEDLHVQAGAIVTDLPPSRSARVPASGSPMIERLPSTCHAQPHGRIALVAAALLAACSAAPRNTGDNLPPRGEPGLSNAPGINRTASESTGHDAVSNGLESCPPSGKREDDPLKGRVVRCPESGPITKKPPRQPQAPPPNK